MFEQKSEIKMNKNTVLSVLFLLGTATSFSQNKIANKAYHELVKKNTKIIFLEMPRAPKLESIYIDKNQKLKLKKLWATYNRIYGIECWQYPRRMNNSDFFDGGHLNYRGAEKYEEWFISKLKPGDTFIFAGKKLELFKIRNMQVLVKKASPKKESKIASWMGGRLALSSQMSELLRQELYRANTENLSPELKALKPLKALKAFETLLTVLIVLKVFMKTFKTFKINSTTAITVL